MEDFGEDFDDLDFPAFDSPGIMKGMDKLKDGPTISPPLEALHNDAGATFFTALNDLDDLEKIW